MPITQDRMLELLTAGEQFATMHDSLLNNLRDVYMKFKRGEIQAETAWLEIGYLAADADSRGARHVIMTERLKYKFTHARNESEMRRKRRKRNYYEMIPEAPGLRAISASTRSAIADGERIGLELEEEARTGIKSKETIEAEMLAAKYHADIAKRDERLIAAGLRPPRTAAELEAANRAEEAALVSDEYDPSTDLSDLIGDDDE